MSRPNQNSIALYRGITPSSVGLDVHGGCGETWTRDFSHAKWYARPLYSYVLEATLLSTAKQFVLMTTDDKGYADYVLAGILNYQRQNSVQPVQMMIQLCFVCRSN